MPDWWGSHHIKGTAAIGRLITIARDELNRENTMFFNARLKTEPLNVSDWFVAFISPSL